MSDEKIDRIDRRVNELVNIVGNLVTAVSELTEQQKVFAEQQKIFAEQQKIFAEQQKGLAEQQKITSAQLADVVRVVIEQNKKQDEMRQDFNVFRQETNENFEKIHNESRILHRKTDWAGAAVVDTDKRVEDLETRVTTLEEKLAA